MWCDNMNLNYLFEIFIIIGLGILILLVIYSLIKIIKIEIFKKCPPRLIQKNFNKKVNKSLFDCYKKQIEENLILLDDIKHYIGVVDKINKDYNILKKELEETKKELKKI